jgi:2-polyprenyl-6-methoxyphenol hydroxylase-like FAD-dependent oxidoreductase
MAVTPHPPPPAHPPPPPPPPPSPTLPVLFDHATAAGARIHTSFDVASTTQHSDNTVSIRSVCGESDGPFDLVVDCSGRHSRLVDAAPENVAQDEPYPYAAMWGVR